MSKNQKREMFETQVPDDQDAESLAALALYFEKLASQLSYAANELRGQKIEVQGTPTFRRGLGFVQNWVGNLFQSISLSGFKVDMASIADEKSEEIKRNKIVKPDLKPKRKAE